MADANAKEGEEDEFNWLLQSHVATILYDSKFFKVRFNIRGHQGKIYGVLRHYDGVRYLKVRIYKEHYDSLLQLGKSFFDYENAKKVFDFGSSSGGAMVDMSNLKDAFNEMKQKMEAQQKKLKELEETEKQKKAEKEETEKQKKAEKEKNKKRKNDGNEDKKKRKQEEQWTEWTCSWCFEKNKETAERCTNKKCKRAKKQAAMYETRR